MIRNSSWALRSFVIDIVHRVEASWGSSKMSYSNRHGLLEWRKWFGRLWRFRRDGREIGLYIEEDVVQMLDDGSKVVRGTVSEPGVNCYWCRRVFGSDVGQRWMLNFAVSTNAWVRLIPGNVPYKEWRCREVWLLTLGVSIYKG